MCTNRFACGAGKLTMLALLLGSGLTGCTAMSNPLVDAIPVRRLSPDLLAMPKDPQEAIPLSLLGQETPDVYRLAPGDALGVYVEGFLGDRIISVPVSIAPPFQSTEVRKAPPSWGYPVIVREDGTIQLPMMQPINVHGKSMAETYELIRRAYVAAKILVEGRERIQITLMQARQYSIVVMRQETGNFSPGAAGPSGIIATSKRGSGHSLTLPAGENDVLHALSLTGGMPALDVYNEIEIHRNRKTTLGPDGKVVKGPEVIKIPLRTPVGQPIPISPQDVVLQNGDTVYLEARDRDLFFTGGLLPSGEFVLPRDHDLDVVEAVAQVRGPLFNGSFSPNNLAGNLIAPGIGNPSPSMLTVVRKLPHGGQVPIRVDLNRAVRDQRERILVKAGDILILQETPGEAFARYGSQTLANFSFTWQAIHSSWATEALDLSAPQQIPARVGITNFTNQ